MFCMTWDRAAMRLADMNRTRLARGRVFICELDARPHLGLNSVGARPHDCDRRGALPQRSHHAHGQRLFTHADTSVNFENAGVRHFLAENTCGLTHDRRVVAAYLALGRL